MMTRSVLPSESRSKASKELKQTLAEMERLVSYLLITQTTPGSLETSKDSKAMSGVILRFLGPSANRHPLARLVFALYICGLQLHHYELTTAKKYGTGSARSPRDTPRSSSDRESKKPACLPPDLRTSGLSR